MIIDITFVILMFVAIYKGFSKGLIIGIFSMLAFIIGLAAALKLSVVAAEQLKASAGSFAKWLPLISFMLVFIAVVLLVKILARLLKKTLRFAMLGWLDALGGMVLYITLYTIIFSIFLFFAAKLSLLQPITILDSKLYPYIAPWGAKVMDSLGKIVPIFKDMFTQLQNFFGNVAKKNS